MKNLPQQLRNLQFSLQILNDLIVSIYKVKRVIVAINKFNSQLICDNLLIRSYIEIKLYVRGGIHFAQTVNCEFI